MPTQETNSSPILLKYQQAFEANKRSRVFAPLAEGYRKLGLIDKALEICREGLRHNPGYVLGHYTLAQCYYDIGQKQLAFDTIRPFIEVNRDNFSLQKFYGQLALQLSEKEEALNTYKYLLFANPRDQDVVQKIKLLEEESSVIVNKENKRPSNPVFATDKLGESSDQGLDDWVTLEFNQNNFAKSSQKQNEKVAPASDISSWTEVKINSNEDTPLLETDSRAELNFDFVVEKSMQQTEDLEFQIDEQDLKGSRSEIPIVTHTLVELYLSQGLTDKALGILKKINELHPEDYKTSQRIQELESLKINIKKEEESGNVELMDLVEKVQTSKNHQKKILLERFLLSIKNRGGAKRYD